MDVLLGVDIGTYSVKAVAVNAQGDLLDTAALQHDVSFPRPGYAEQDPESVWWEGLRTAVRQLIARGTFQVSQVRALGVSTLSPCVAALDRDNRPLRPAILYGMDVRAGKQIQRLNEELGEGFVLDRFGQLLSSQTAGPKIMWIREEQPELFRQAARFVPASTYLVHKLTGEWRIDAYIAPSYAPFFRMDTMEWDDEMIRTYLADDTALKDGIAWPELGWPGDLAGVLTAEAAAATGLAAGIPVVIGSADALAEAISAAALTPGDLFMMYGSSMFFIATTHKPVTRSETFWPSPGLAEGAWAVAGGMSAAGSLVRWVMDLAYPPGTPFETFFAAAKTSVSGSNGLVMLPYFSGERTPLGDPDARGVIAGLSLKHNAADLSRAALEAVAYGIRHNIEAFEALLGPVSLIGAGGGVTDPFWAQIVTDVSQRPQRIMQNTNAAIGDALLAGTGAGLFGHSFMKELALRIGRPVELQPNPELGEVYDARYKVYRELYINTREQIVELGKR
ncbi:FGGY-family carbohydrate kinase [Paenibacillus macerans]|uniref:FGGY-family carbohydrate kinase n=1 Tax=Paenibacillus macerans TaxID=44252 RepID=UPI00203EFCEE|nr:FGGY family carbohydrate kinase [Paenibacillus macerans]MCM3703982.1 FGGY family carbohydrate kinase [Paenibacillus macerans]